MMPDLWPLIESLYISPSIAHKNTDEWEKYRSSPKNVDIQAVESEFKSSITSFVEIVRAFGSKPILMTQFNRLKKEDDFVRSLYDKKSHNLDYNSFVLEYKKFNEIIRDIAKEKGVLLIDLDRQIPPNNNYIYDAVHVNNNGSNLVAEIIAKTIALHDRNYIIQE